MPKLSVGVIDQKMVREHPRRGSRILKWGVNFCINNLIEPKPG